MSYCVYHLVNSRSQRILWLMQELELAYDLEICDPIKNNASYQKLKTVQAQPKFPMLRIDHMEGQVLLSESTAIADYLSQKYKRLSTDGLDKIQRIDFYYWKNFADASFMPNMALKQIFSQMVMRTPFFARPISMLIKFAFDKGFLNDALDQQMQQIDAHLSQRTWLAGSSFSIADIMLWFPLRACFYSHPKFKHYLGIERYLNDLEKRPAFQQALNQGQWSETQFEKYWRGAW